MRKDGKTFVDKSFPKPFQKTLFLGFLILLFWNINGAHSEIILDQKDGIVRHTEAQGLPTIVYSTTLLTASPNTILQSFILSIFPDGSANVKQTVDTQRNLSLTADSRKIILQTFGPKILPEQAQSRLQQYFAKTVPWNIPKKAFVSRKEKGFWIAELSLQTETSRHHCTFSSSEKQHPEVEQIAYDFLAFLEQVCRFVCNDPLTKKDFS